MPGPSLLFSSAETGVLKLREKAVKKLTSSTKWMATAKGSDHQQLNQTGHVGRVARRFTRREPHSGVGPRYDQGAVPHPNPSFFLLYSASVIVAGKECST